MNLSDFKKLYIDDVELSKMYFGAYRNLAPSSIDTNGDVYGYIEGYRLNHTGGYTAQANTVTTGFIACKSTSVIRMFGTIWLHDLGWETYVYLTYYDSNFNMLGCVKWNHTFLTDGNLVVDVDNSSIAQINGVTTFEIAFADGTDPSEIAYFRINGIGSGADMVVTVDEEIVDVLMWVKPTAYTNQVPISTDTDGSIYNGVGYKENVRLSSSGGVSSSAQNGSVTTGFIPFPHGDETIIRMKGVAWLTVPSTGHFYINFYDANKNFLTYKSSSEINAGNVSHVITVTRDADGVETVTFNTEYGTSNSFLQYVRNDAKYIRITAYGKGADMIVTVDEEIA